MNYNALHDPWIPIAGAHGVENVSLRGLFERGHELADLAPTLFPAAREALLRLLASAASVALRGATDDEIDELGETGSFPSTALDQLDTYTDRFWLRHDTMPFLQAWGRAPHPSDNPQPLAGLDPHMPGGSSSRWGLRPVEQNPDAATILRGLTLTWFHSKWSNGAAPEGYFKMVAGAPGYGGARDLTLHWIGANLGLTIAAAVHQDWVEDTDLPAWLDQDTYPSAEDLARNPQSLWRATYTPNRPVLHWDPSTAEPTGFVIGCVAGSLRPVPALPITASTKSAKPGEASESIKATLAAIHERDITRAYRDVAKAGEPPALRKVTARTHQLLSTEGAINWFKNDLGSALRGWGSQRVAPASHTKPAWRLGCYLEECDGTGGTRRRSDWVVLDSALLTVDGPAADSVNTVLTFMEKMHKEVRSQIGVAAEGAQGRTAAHAVQAGTALYAALDDLVFEMLAAATTGSISAYHYCREALVVAVRVFAEQTEPLRTPSTTAQVEIARAALAAKIHRHLPTKPEEAVA